MSNELLTKTIEENYCEVTDKTFIMEYTMDGDKLVSGECVGWYCGEPDPESTKKYSNRQMKAVY